MPSRGLIVLYQAIALILAAGVLLAADTPEPVRGTNELLEIKATAHPGKEAVRKLLGNDLDGFICVVEVTVTPLGDKPVALNRDDFLLISGKDGQRSAPFAPSQIAGQGAIIVSSRGGGGGIATQSTGPVWGGIGGPPRRLPGQGTVLGTASEPSSATARVDDGGKAQENPLLATLKERELPQKETLEPVSGLLYFPLEGKHKPKDLQLIYKGAGGKVSVQFR
ncbi:MAG: hypothetical protein IRZ15_03100 [Bryobacteraceae bacterium]|nr:hypothetical protein [Bryobacteraceae bacterium]